MPDSQFRYSVPQLHWLAGKLEQQRSLDRQSVEFNVEFDEKAIKRLAHFIHNLDLKAARAEFRRQRPFRKAVRRSLSRKRIAATRAWHEDAALRAAYDELYSSFGMGSYGWENDSRNPYKGVRR